MNRHSSTYNVNDQLSLDDLRAYQADQLSGPDRHRVERLMLENPFYADALDGLDALQQVGGSLKSQTRDLHIALQERVHESATPRRLMPLWVTSMVASVLLVLSVSIYLIFNQKSFQKQALSPASRHIEPGTVLLDPNDLGTSEASVAAPKVMPPVAKRSEEQLINQSKKVAQKRHRAVAKRSAITVQELPTGGTQDRAFSSIAEEMPLPLHVDLDIRDRRHVNTERAFLN